MLHKYLILLLAATLMMQSCKEESTDPVLTLTQAQSITNPTNNENIVLTSAMKDDVWSITWSAAIYSLNNVGKTYYTVELDVAGNSFSSPLNLGTTTDLNKDITVGELNNKLILKGLPIDVPASLEMRVVASVEQKSENVYSEVVTFSVTPYGATVTVKPIYLLGSGSLVGWDNAQALPFTYLEDGRYEIVTTLTAGTDQFIKIISKLGAWAPQWGTDATGTSANGPLVYRPTEDVADPPAIPVPDVTSEYKIIVDTALLTYEIFEFGYVYILGDATLAGWDNTKALPFAKTGEGKFAITTTLEGGKNWKIIDERGAWAPQWGTDGTGTPNEGVLSYRETEAVPDPAAIAAPADSGTYLIEIDIINLTYKVTLI